MNDKHAGEIILYQPDSALKLEVRVEDETVWLSQAQMVALFGRNQSVISRHITNIFKEGELDENSNMHFLHIANADRPTAFYNLEVIISVGYRVKSKQGILFRQWANRVLKEYLLRGFAINQRFERIEQRVSETEKQIEIIVKTALSSSVEWRLQNEIMQLKQYIEAVLANYNDINEDTRMQLEHINEILANLQSDHHLTNKPRNPIGFRTDKLNIK